MGLSEDNQQVRKLSRAVMRGEVSRGDYQRERRALIDSYTGDTGGDDEDDISLTGTGNVPVVNAMSDDTTPNLPKAPRAIEPITPLPSGDEDDGPPNDVWIGLVAVVIVVAVVAALVAWFL